ncbi:MAG: hypothetical protein Sylvanvirus22_14, partial [Sylvanvirus sp.]
VTHVPNSRKKIKKNRKACHQVIQKIKSVVISDKFVFGLYNTQLRR